MSAPRRNLLVAVDGSVASLEAARLALDIAAACHGSVRALAVVDDDTAYDRREGDTRGKQLEHTLEYVRHLGSEAGLEVETVLRHRGSGAPYEVILEEAERWPADQLFMGRRSHRGLGRALLGSQTEHVLEFAPLPVVVVPESAPSLRS